MDSSVKYSPDESPSILARHPLQRVLKYDRSELEIMILELPCPSEAEASSEPPQAPTKRSAKPRVRRWTPKAVTGCFCCRLVRQLSNKITTAC